MLPFRVCFFMGWLFGGFRDSCRCESLLFAIYVAFIDRTTSRRKDKRVLLDYSRFQNRPSCRGFEIEGMGDFKNKTEKGVWGKGFCDEVKGIWGLKIKRRYGFSKNWYGLGVSTLKGEVCAGRVFWGGLGKSWFKGERFSEKSKWK